MARSVAISDAKHHTPGDRRLAALASRQHGVVALGQLKALGLTASGVRDRVRSGRLHRLHRGVYAVGHRNVSPRGRWLAAVLACGPGAALSHRSAAALRGLRPTGAAKIDVTAPRRSGRRRAGITVHAGGTLARRDVTTIDGIPCTSTARTLLDLADVVDRQALTRACEQAEILRSFNRRELVALLERSPGRQGAPVLQAIVERHAPEPTRTRQELERCFLELCERGGVQRPSVNAHVEGLEVDFSWAAHRVIAETDGFAVHGTRSAFERDRHRDQRLLLAGWRIARFTWRQVTESPEEVAQTLRRLTADSV